MGLFTKPTFTPDVAAGDTMRIAAQDYAWLNNELRPYTKLERPSLMPGQLEYLKVICAILLKQATVALGEAGDTYFDDYMTTILNRMQDVPDAELIVQVLQTQELYDDVGYLMGLPMDELIAVATKRVAKALPYSLSAKERDILVDFMVVRLPKLTEGIQKHNFEL
ncbi:MAG TPA: hypothetical protein VLF40_04950 [Candidatus Saccharimonadales bacterium]|nr:hypothetical protein [Candidatus Saccharimonadales bacterium]